MNRTKRTIAAAVCALFLLLPLTAQEKSDTVYTFRFMPDRDMFHISYGGNDAELERLLQCVEQRRADILSGETPLYVDGYCNAFDGEAENLAMAKTRSNRVKSELIVRQKLSEDCFITKNHSGGGDYVTVRIVIPAERDEAEEARLAAGRAKQEKEAAEQAERQRIAAEKAEAERIAREKEQERIAEQQARQAAEKAGADSLAAAQSITGSPVTETAATNPAAFRYAGIQGGMPFGISAMSSFGADRTTPGWSAGIYGGYRFNPVLSLELQASWGRLVMNRRDCCPDYWTGTDGNRYEAAVAGMDGWYMSALRSHTFVQRYAAQLNVNLLGFFRSTRDSRWSLDLSPHIAAIGTESDFRLVDGSTDVLQGGTRWHLGAGGNMQASYTFPIGLQIGVYTGMTYLTGKPLDGTPRHLHKANCIWESGLRLGWSFGSKAKE